MKIVRFAAAPDGGSQFVEIDFPVDNASTDAWGHTARRSAVLPAQSTMVTEMPEHLYQDWHPASRRQLLIVLSGTLEVETSDGTKHRCSSGGGVSRGRCRQPWPSHSHHRRPGPRAVRASAARRQSRRLIASYQNSVRQRDCGRLRRPVLPPAWLATSAATLARDGLARGITREAARVAIASAAGHRPDLRAGDAIVRRGSGRRGRRPDLPRRPQRLGQVDLAGHRRWTGAGRCR